MSEVDLNAFPPAQPRSTGTPAVRNSADYVSPGFEMIALDRAFPHMIVGDTATNAWPYLRQDIGHAWYVDERSPTVGFVNRDEASILFNAARKFAGKPCLEIGCWRGWSSAHLASGSNTLVVFDPALADPVFCGDVSASLAAAGVEDRVKLFGGRSPEDVEAYTKNTGIRWSLVFIDGDHDDDAPRRDAELISRLAAPSAMVMFHDLMSPDVARGLLQMKALGWQVRLYMTTQIMAIAWRGTVEPLAHVPDPAQAWWLPAHLYGLSVSGAPKGFKYRKWQDGAWRDCSRKVAQTIAQELQFSLDGTGAPVRPAPKVTVSAPPAEDVQTDKLMEAFAALQRENARLQDDAKENLAETERLKRDVRLLESANENLAEAERRTHDTRVADLEAALQDAEAKLAQADRLMDAFAALQRENAALQESVKASAAETDRVRQDTRLALGEKVRELATRFEAREAALLGEVQERADALHTAEAHRAELAAALAQAEHQLERTVGRVRDVVAGHAATEEALRQQITEANARTAAESARAAALIAAQEQREAEVLDLHVALDQARHFTAGPSIDVQGLEDALRLERARVDNMREAKAVDEARLLDYALEVENLRRNLHAHPAPKAVDPDQIVALEEALQQERARVDSMRDAKAADEARLLEYALEVEALRRAASALPLSAHAYPEQTMAPSAQPVAVTRGTGLRRLLRRFTHRREAGVIKAIRLSGQFDAAWYLKTYRDVGASGADPVEHYVRHGAADGRDPSPVFHTKGYLSANADVRKEGINPFLHYIKFGKAEGRRTR